MNILIVAPTLPSPSSGGPTRNYYLLKTLALKHTVSLIALNEGDRESVHRCLARLKELTHTIQVVPRPEFYPKRLEQLLDVMRGKSYVINSYRLTEMQEAIDRLLASEAYDLVFFESVLIDCYRLPANVKVVIDQHNIEYEVRLRTFQREKAWVRKWYNWLESRLIKPVEIERCRRANTVVVTSEREQLALKRMLPRNVIEVVPNGVDTGMFHEQQHLKQEVPGRIIFTGSLEYYPNVDAVLYFARRCWPLIRAEMPGATWQIVGKNPLPEVRKLDGLPGITVIGSVPDMRPYLALAEVAIAPLLIGSGTRLKILEALAMRKAVVSTSLGCEGLSVESGKHIIVADQPEVFAQGVLTLLRNPQMRSAFGKAGRELVEAEYSWEQCGTRLLNILENSF